MTPQDMYQYRRNIQKYNQHDIHTWEGRFELTSGLHIESGEVHDKMYKLFRDYLNRGEYPPADFKDRMIAELGDVMFFWMMCCVTFNIDPLVVMQQNNYKLEKRYREGKINGEGDDR